MNKVKWGVLGTAGIAKGATIPGMLQAEHCELYAIAGRKAEKAADYQKTFGFRKAYGSYDELLAPLDEASVRKDCLRWNDDYLKWLKNTKAMRNHLSDSRMVNWLAGLKELTKASDEQMHLYFPEYY